MRDRTPVPPVAVLRTSAESRAEHIVPRGEAVGAVELQSFF